MDCTLLQWLNSQPDKFDLVPFGLKDGVEYMPIPVVRKKMAEMTEKFKVEITQTDVSVFAVAVPGKDADVIFTATVKLELKHSEFIGGVKKICGTASFYIGQYAGSWSFAQIAESLATVRAFNKEWNQFGKKECDIEDPVAKMKLPIKATPNKLQNSL